MDAQLIKNIKKNNIITHLYVLILSFFIFLILIFFRKKNKNISNCNAINIITVKRNNGLSIIAENIFDHLIKNNFSANIVYLSDNKKFITNQIFDVNIFIGNPDILLPSFLKLQGIKLLNSYNIGLWFWELEKYPKIWNLTSSLVNEIWTFSDFTHNSLFKLSKVSKKVPFFINLNMSKVLKKYHFFDKNKFIFIFTFDFLSYFERKNPLGVITAFLEKFENNNNVKLIIKSTNGEYKTSENNLLAQKISKYKNIIYINKYMNYYDNLSLIYSSNCYISLHRSEGLGLGMAEAMFLGIPVIATNYSGNLEFMNKTNSFLVQFRKKKLKKDDYIYSNNQFWADPDIKHAAYLMELVFTNSNLRIKTALEGEKNIKEKYSFLKFQEFLNDFFLKA